MRDGSNELYIYVMYGLGILGKKALCSCEGGLRGIEDGDQRYCDGLGAREGRRMYDFMR